MKKQFEEIVKNEFKDSPDILSKIKESPRFKVEPKERTSILSFFVGNRYKMSFATVFVIALLLFTNLNTTTQNQVYASSVTIDINPSIQIQLDEDDLVMEVIALNDDGEVLIEKDLDYKRMDIDTVVNHIVNQAIKHGYLDPEEVENVILVHVEGKTEEVEIRVREKMIIRFDTEAKKHLPKVDVVRARFDQLTEEQQERIVSLAEHYNVSVGKMIYVLQIDKLDNQNGNEYTLRQLTRMNTRQLHQVEKQLNN